MLAQDVFSTTLFFPSFMSSCLHQTPLSLLPCSDSWFGARGQDHMYVMISLQNQADIHSSRWHIITVWRYFLHDARL